VCSWVIYYNHQLPFRTGDGASTGWASPSERRVGKEEKKNMVHTFVVFIQVSGHPYQEILPSMLSSFSFDTGESINMSSTMAVLARITQSFGLESQLVA
jgi:hypothetical protein